MNERPNEQENAEEIRSAVQVAPSGNPPGTLSSPASVRTSFGLPIGVSRVVDLPRAPTEREWGQLISSFRTMFGVQGKATTANGLREWSHGNLHISIEPTAEGELLRVSDSKQDAVVINGLGVGMGLMGTLVSAVMVADGQTRKGLLAFGVFGGMALFTFLAAHLFRTPLWARDRQRQAQEIADHAVKLLSNP